MDDPQDQDVTVGRRQSLDETQDVFEILG